MWNKIINPQTGRKVSIYGRIGKKILHKYINQIGGSNSELVLAKLAYFEPAWLEHYYMEYDEDELDDELLVAQPDLTLTDNNENIFETYIIKDRINWDTLPKRFKQISLSIYKPWIDTNKLPTTKDNDLNSGLVHICDIEILPNRILLMDDGFNLVGNIVKCDFNQKIQEMQPLSHPFATFKNIFKIGSNHEINITKIIKKYFLYYKSNNKAYSILIQLMLSDILDFNELNNIDKNFYVNRNSNQNGALFINYKNPLDFSGSQRFKIHLSIKINHWYYVFSKIIKFFNNNSKYLASMKFFIINEAHHQYNKHSKDNTYIRQTKDWYEYIAGAGTANFVIYPSIPKKGKNTKLDNEAINFKKVLNRLIRYCNDEGIDKLGRIHNNLFYNERVTKSIYIAYGSSSSQKSNMEQLIYNYQKKKLENSESAMNCIVVIYGWEGKSFDSGQIIKINDKTYDVLKSDGEVLKNVDKRNVYTGDNYIQRFKNENSDWVISPMMKKERDNICSNDDDSYIKECLEKTYNVTKEELCNEVISPVDFWFTKAHSKPGDDLGLVSRCSF